MKSTLVLAGILCAAAVLSGCGSTTYHEDVYYDDTPHPVTSDTDSEGPAGSDGSASASRAGLVEPEAGDIYEAPLETEQMRVQRSGVIRLDVKIEMKMSGAIRRSAGQFDAIVMSFSDHEVNLKMPSEKLDALIAWFEKQKDVEIDSYDFTAWDRTGEFYSVEARLESTKAVKERLLGLLELAKTLEEVERIEQKLETVQQQLDNLETVMRDIRLRAGRVDVQIILD